MSILEPSTGDLLGAFQTTFSKVSPLGFMCLVHELENIHSWHGNELFTSDFRSFHGLFMAAPSSFADCAGEERENGWL